ncbi:MAG: restriction endonuclease subunit S [Prevotella sp.]|nr:restriction endonuclease subunit S [Prevotella sp.]
MANPQTYNRIPALRFPEFINDGEWEVKRLGDIAELYAGATPLTTVAEYWENGTIPWMSSGEVHNGQIFKTEKAITTLGYDSCSTKMIPANSVVVALAGQGKTRGTVAITRIPLCTNQSLCSIIPNDNYNSDYLYLYLSSQYENLREISSGDGSRGGLNLQMLRDFLIPFPPLAEQERIAQSLLVLEELIKTASNKLELLKSHKQGLMQQLFAPLNGGGKSLIINRLQIPKIRFPEFENTKGWEVKKLGEIITTITVTRKLPSTDYHENGKYPIVDQSQQYICGYSDDTEALIKLNGDAVIVFGDHTCTLKYIDFDFIQGADGIKICKSSEHEKIDTQFLYYCLCASPINPTEYKRHFSDLKEKSVSWPKALSEQRKIADCLSSLDETIRLYNDKLTVLRHHKRGLMQQLFPQA